MDVICVFTFHFYWGSAPNQIKYVEQVEKSFFEMKGDVGMSHHKKKENKKMPIPRQEIIDNPIPTSLFSTKLSVHIYKCSYLSSNCTSSSHTQQNSCIAHTQRCRDGRLSMISCLGIGIFLFPFFFMM